MKNWRNCFFYFLGVVAFWMWTTLAYQAGALNESLLCMKEQIGQNIKSLGDTVDNAHGTQNSLNSSLNRQLEQLGEINGNLDETIKSLDSVSEQLGIPGPGQLKEPPK